MPVSCRRTPRQDGSSLHRFQENKREVQVYDYADVSVPVPASMYNTRLAGTALGYTVSMQLNV
jgi:hypothetical protein